ncbi:hypothetical protein CBF23_007725 [Marinomonas agarivorans]|nr:hypothetical protein CBF23_007725 [Marinomonas agarivorans]
MLILFKTKVQPIEMKYRFHAYHNFSFNGLENLC